MSVVEVAQSLIKKVRRNKPLVNGYLRGVYEDIEHASESYVKVDELHRQGLVSSESLQEEKQRLEEVWALAQSSIL